MHYKNKYKISWIIAVTEKSIGKEWRLKIFKSDKKRFNLARNIVHVQLVS